MMQAVKWIESAGGPLVIVPESKAHFWRGTETDDYAAACGVDAYTSVLERAWGSVLILGDAPFRTAAISTDSGIALVRWMYAQNEEVLLDAAVHFDSGSQEPIERQAFSFGEDPYAIFDSGSVGGETPRLTFKPPPAAHGLATYVVEVAEELGFLLRAFIPASGPTERRGRVASAGVATRSRR